MATAVMIDDASPPDGVLENSDDDLKDYFHEIDDIQSGKTDSAADDDDLQCKTPDGQCVTSRDVGVARMAVCFCLP